jgi:uncharacterized lipoprotein YmbA
MSLASLYRAVAAIVLVVTIAACTSPNPALYTIAPVQGTPQARGPSIVVLQQIGLARYLERQEIVRSSENYRLDVMANDWWGEPLSAMLSRILIQELSQRMPHSTVLPSSGAVSVTPDATIELNVQRLDEDAAGHLVLLAQASVEFKGRGAPLVRSFSFSETPPAPGTPGEVAAISTAGGQLAVGRVSMRLARAAGR